MRDPVWLATAKNIPAGRYVKIECCAADRSMRVSNDPRGYRAYCFRCGPVGFVAHGDFSIDQLRRRREELEWRNTNAITLPNDFTTDIPTSEALWLYKAGVSHAVAQHYRFGYSPALRRVILPIYTGGVLSGYTARSTINERPKYIEKVASPTSTVWLSDSAIALPTTGTDDLLPCTVLTEDILSAVRVGRLVRNGVSLMGTSLSPEQLHTIHGLSGPQLRIVVWLDPDKAGKKAGASVLRTLRLQGINASLIRSDKDPKYYSNREIRRFLTE